MLKFRVVLLVFVSGLSSIGAAAPPDPCRGSSTREMEACAAKRGAEAKTQMARYLEESKRLIGENQEDLKALGKSQELWGKFVDADCQAAYQHFVGGSIRSVQYGECVLAHTENRTLSLWERYLAGTVSKLRKPAGACD